jgi:hypothetical protein
MLRSNDTRCTALKHMQVRKSPFCYSRPGTYRHRHGMFLGHRPVFVLLQHQNHCHNTVSSQQLVYKAQSGPQTSPHHPPSPNVQQHDAPRFSAEVHCTDLPQCVQQQREHNLQRIGDTTAPAQHPANHAVHPADRGTPDPTHP